MSDIVSKQRVKAFGEVYTPMPLVKQMCDMIADKFYNVDVTVLEPTCGNGNFLAYILESKLQPIAYEEEFETEIDDDTNAYLGVLRAVSTTYGFDIQQDNVDATISRLFNIVVNFCGGIDLPLSYRRKEVIRDMLAKNIRKADVLDTKHQILVRKLVFREKRVECSVWDYFGLMKENPKPVMVFSIDRALFGL